MKKLRITIGNKSYEVTVEDLTGDDAYPGRAVPPSPAAATGSPMSIPPAVAPQRIATSPPGLATAGAVTSPMAGAIRAVQVKVGDSVKRGDALVVLEAMKMENQITAPMTGIVISVHVAEGDTVSEGHVLLVLE